MGRQIIKQPNGKYAVWTSEEDRFVILDATKDELVQMYSEAAAKRAAKDVEDTIAELESGDKPYYQFTMTWDEAMELHKEVHGDDAEEIVFDDRGQLSRNSGAGLPSV